MRRRLASLALALTCALAASVRAAAPPAGTLDGSKPGRLVRLPDGRRIDLRCAGPLGAGPTVILEGGFAATSMAWYKVMPLVARGHRVCAYDRAGYGFSDPGPMPRDGEAVALDLDRALRAARINGPFVMVGHSAGGLYVRLFAERRPGQVVGMVLVDPSVEYQDRRFAAAFGPGAGSLGPLRKRAVACLAAARRRALPSLDPGLLACGPRPGASAQAAREARDPDNWRTQISELDTLWNATSDEVAAGPAKLGSMPLVVLTAADTYGNLPPRARAAVEGLWAGLHRELADRSTRGSAQLVAGSSHMMMLDRPDAVAAAVDEVIAATKR